MTVFNLDINNSDECDHFRSIYEKAFPIDDEREPFETIIERIHTEINGVKTRSYILKENAAIIGGIVIDIYAFENYSLAEIIYIAIDEKYRSRGYGSILLHDSLEQLKAEMNEYGIPIKHLFLEVEKVDENNELTVKRMKFWQRNGATIIPIKYKQPPLAEDKEWFDGLNLILLNENSISVDDLVTFLTAFCKGLGVECYNIEIDTHLYDFYKNN